MAVLTSVLIQTAKLKRWACSQEVRLLPSGEAAAPYLKRQKWGSIFRLVRNDNRYLGYNQARVHSHKCQEVEHA
jgi:hypothetical protein